MWGVLKLNFITFTEIILILSTLEQRDFIPYEKENMSYDSKEKQRTDEILGQLVRYELGLYQ